MSPILSVSSNENERERKSREKEKNRKKLISFSMKIIFLLGYFRIIFAILAFYYAFSDCYTFFILYGLSAALDMADGYAARYYNQCISL